MEIPLCFFHCWSYHGAWICVCLCLCSYTCLCTFTLCVSYEMPQITTRPFTFNYSFHQCIKNTLTLTPSTQPRAPPPGHCSFAFHIVFLSFFFCFFICHKRNKLLLHVPQSYYCGYRCHVLIIMCIVSIMSAFPRFPLSPFHSHSGIFICQFYICISQSLCLSLRLSTPIIPLHFQLILLSFMLYSLLLLLSCQMIWTMESQFASVHFWKRKRTTVSLAFF